MPKPLTPRGEAAPFVEPNISGAKITKGAAKKAPAAKKAKQGTNYAYNLRGVSARVTLDSGRELLFEPRGQRGDLQPVSPEEMEDSKFLMNYGYIFEVVSSELAAQIISKQSFNSNQGKTLYDHLTNSKGEKYEKTDIHVEPQKQRSIVVGQITADNGSAHTNANPEGLVVRTAAAGPQEVSVPGSRGHYATQQIQELPDNLAAEDVAEFMAWKRAQAEAQAAANQMGQG